VGPSAGSDGEQKASIGAEYAAINTTPGVTPGAPLGLPENATTVRVEDAVIGDPQVWAEPYFNDAAGERALKQ
jgi:hypothetical protein